MTLSHFFIDRPIFATVLSIVIVVAGAIAYFTLPVAQYPEVVPPTVVVRASYPGATPEVISETVGTPIEQEVNGVENMLYMSSQSTSDGQMQLTITFRLGTDLTERNLAAATARVGVATADLFPRIALAGSIALQATSFLGLGDRGSETFAVGPGIFWAAFDLGRVRARIRAADARTEAALAQYEQRVLLALEETENTLVDFTRQQARRDLLRASAQASEKAQNLARERYQFGVADFLTVLDAERTLLAAQDQLADSETRTATAVAVYKALGGGWEIAPESVYSKAP